MIYPGVWIFCRNCLFPVRLPCSHGISIRDFSRKRGALHWLAPLAGTYVVIVRQISKGSASEFPIPRRKKAVLYAVDLGCANRQCQHTVRIYTVAATTVSVASLLELWKHWVIHMRCQGHPFRPLSRRTWGIYSAYGPR